LCADCDFAALKDRRILAVDDCVQITSLLRDVFATCGAKISVVNSGEAAILHVCVTHFDLVLLDIRMPGIDGWDVLRYMRTTKPYLLARTILITGDRYSRAAVGDSDLPRMCIVYKPFELDYLRTVACRVLARPMDTQDIRTSRSLPA